MIALLGDAQGAAALDRTHVCCAVEFLLGGIGYCTLVISLATVMIISVATVSIAP